MINLYRYIKVGRDSSAGIANRLGVDSPWMESRWEARFPALVQTGPGAHRASYTIGTGSFPGVNRPGRGADHTHPHLAPRLKKEYSCKSTSPGAFVACSRLKFTSYCHIIYNYLSSSYFCNCFFKVGLA